MEPLERNRITLDALNKLKLAFDADATRKRSGNVCQKDSDLTWIELHAIYKFVETCYQWVEGKDKRKTS